MDDNDSWEQRTIKSVLESSVKEMRARRRWGIFFKSLFAVLIIYIIASFSHHGVSSNVTRKPFTAVITIDGEISSDKDASAENIIPLLNKAFENSAAKAVMLRINSPGGAPVQTSAMITEIKHLRSKHPEKKVYAVIEDTGASAAYMLACAADAIYADEASIVGSIGVISESFGLVDAIKKLGIERRLYASGSNKGMLDPFSPMKPNQVKMLQNELDLLHESFIAWVKQARGDRLVVTDDMFSGRIWIGSEAKALGLIDGFGSPNTVARDIIGAPELVDYDVKQSIFSQLKGSITGSLQGLLVGHKLS
ncbi:MAG TPA: S49 family peptidase [Gammaproteobacteria bacterium]|nr:S49 family peptidase [Gammaproteobacteria bacterium]